MISTSQGYCFGFRLYEKHSLHLKRVNRANFMTQKSKSKVWFLIEKYRKNCESCQSQVTWKVLSWPRWPPRPPWQRWPLWPPLPPWPWRPWWPRQPWGSCMRTRKLKVIWKANQPWVNEWLTQSVTYVGIELLWQLKTICHDKVSTLKANNFVAT